MAGGGHYFLYFDVGDEVVAGGTGWPALCIYKVVAGWQLCGSVGGARGHHFFCTFKALAGVANIF